MAVVVVVSLLVDGVEVEVVVDSGLADKVPLDGKSDGDVEKSLAELCCCCCCCCSVIMELIAVVW